MRPPLGITQMVRDTPGGLHGLGLAKVAMVADAILIPVFGSAFDCEAASDCWAERRVHPRVASGACQVAAIGMRLDRRTQAEEIASDWAASIGLNWLCRLSIFDMPASVTEIDREQRQPLLARLSARGFETSEPGSVAAIFTGDAFAFSAITCCAAGVAESSHQR